MTISFLLEKMTAILMEHYISEGSDTHFENVVGGNCSLAQLDEQSDMSNNFK